MAPTLDLIAIIQPKAGGADRVVELLNEIAEYARKNEPGTLRYEIHRQINQKSGDDEVIMVESYKDQAALAEHGKSVAFANFHQKAKEEGLIGGPMQLKFVKVAGGFASRL